MNSQPVSQLFGARADAYANFRPHYPPSLFNWLADQCPRRQRALDIACGNGQASYPLLEHFEQLLACDSSLQQLQAGQNQPGLQQFVAEATKQPLPSRSLDLIVVAQALHWFATPALFAEVRRLLQPGGVFCAWCYSLMRIDSPIDALMITSIGKRLAATGQQDAPVSMLAIATSKTPSAHSPHLLHRLPHTGHWSSYWVTCAPGLRCSVTSSKTAMTRCNNWSPNCAKSGVMPNSHALSSGRYTFLQERQTDSIRTTA
ncbi:class I SAM-dependent methyltransferase [Pseudomonas sp. GLN_6]|uniref:class I SAM-dependent methyltransferase n=1 Tax=Pseudomonas sp. GLN_6 TaxID=3367183 RepID=UPI00370BD61D